MQEDTPESEWRLRAELFIFRCDTFRYFAILVKIGAPHTGQLPEISVALHFLCTSIRFSIN